MLDLLHATLRSLRAHALRFTLTSLGIVWGAFMLTYLSASMEGTERHFVRAMQKAGPKIVYMGGGAVLKPRVGERGARQVELEEEDAQRLARVGVIEDASPNVNLWNETVRAGGRTKLLNVQGLSDRGAAMRNFQVARGRFFTPLDLERGARVAFLGADAATRLFGRSDPLERRLQIGGSTFRVVGVAERKGAQLVNTLSPDDLKVLVPHTTAMRWLTRDEALSELMFTPTTRDLSGDAVRRARETVARHHDFHPDLETALWFFDIQEALQLIGGMLLALRLFLLVAGITTLLVGAVGVMNIMLVVVGERTNEIGLRKAVGASRRAIFLQFFAEAGAVCVASGAVGTAAGVGFAQLIARNVSPDSPFASVPAIDFITVASIALGLVVVGIVAGVAPALRASQVPPAEALRAV
ncbi:MAG: ABC transporter permease [Myxococcota bacterium]